MLTPFCSEREYVDSCLIKLLCFKGFSCTHVPTQKTFPRVFGGEESRTSFVGVNSQTVTTLWRDKLFHRSRKEISSFCSNDLCRLWLFFCHVDKRWTTSLIRSEFSFTVFGQFSVLGYGVVFRWRLYVSAVPGRR